jgi:uncharacterized protein
MKDDLSVLTEFGGTARLFPLPNLVLFPNVVQPLHIFEPRYRQMTAEALADDRLLAPVLLRPGWEEDYDGRPAVHPVACLGRILAEQLLPDGRYDLLLRGLSRVRIVREVEDDRLFRTARVELLPDASALSLPDTMALRQELSGQVLPRFAGAGPARQQLQKLFKGELSLSELCDILSFALPIPLEDKQALLEELDIGRRVRLLIETIPHAGLPTPDQVAAANRKFPPDFSSN